MQTGEIDGWMLGVPRVGGDLAESNVGFQMSDKGNVKTEVVMVELKQFRMVLTNIDELPEGHAGSLQVATGGR